MLPDQILKMLRSFHTRNLGKALETKLFWVKLTFHVCLAGGCWAWQEWKKTSHSHRTHSSDREWTCVGLSSACSLDLCRRSRRGRSWRRHESWCVLSACSVPWRFYRTCRRRVFEDEALSQSHASGSCAVTSKKKNVNIIAREHRKGLSKCKKLVWLSFSRPIEEI